MNAKDILIISAMGLGIITKFIFLIVGGAMTISLVAAIIHTCILQG